MARPGPLPKPTALKELEGNPGQRALNDREPRYPRGAPQAPKEVKLNAPAKKVWEDLATKMIRAGVLKNIDHLALARYCDMIVNWMNCAAFVRKNGFCYQVKDTYEVTDPDTGDIVIKEQVVDSKEFKEAKAYFKLDTALTKLEGAFGMSPATRSRIIARFSDPDGMPKQIPDEEPAPLPEGPVPSSNNVVNLFDYDN